MHYCALRAFNVQYLGRATMASSFRMSALAAMMFFGINLPPLLYMDLVVLHGHWNEPPVHEKSFELTCNAVDNRTAATASITVLSDTIILKNPYHCRRDFLLSTRITCNCQDAHGHCSFYTKLPK